LLELLLLLLFFFFGVLPKENWHNKEAEELPFCQEIGCGGKPTSANTALRVVIVVTVFSALRK